MPGNHPDAVRADSLRRTRIVILLCVLPVVLLVAIVGWAISEPRG